MPQFTFRGSPRTPEDWAALARVASGSFDLSKDELRRLFMLGLVDRQLGRVCLSEHGRTVIALPDKAHPLLHARDHAQLGAR